MIYTRIRDLREDYGYTQSKMAKRLNIAQRTYSRYENGEHTIPTEILCEIANIFNTSTDYLLNRTDLQKAYPKPGDYSKNPNIILI